MLPLRFTKFRHDPRLSMEFIVKKHQNHMKEKSLISHIPVKAKDTPEGDC